MELKIVIKRILLFSAVLAFSLTMANCAGTHQASGVGSQDSEISLERIMKELPAETQLKQRLMSQIIIGMGCDSIMKCIRLLEDPAGVFSLAAEYAVDGVTQYAAALEQGSADKVTVQNCLVKGCSDLRTTESKRFLLDRLNWIADDAQIPFLANLLRKQDVCEPAIRVLTTIGSVKAAKALHHALASSAGGCREGVIQALGILDHTAAVEDLLRIAADESGQESRIAVEALIAMGCKRILPLLDRGEVEKNRADLYRVQLAQHLQRSGDEAAAGEIYERLLADDGASPQIKAAALTGLMKKPNASALDRLIVYFSSPHPMLRQAALHIAEDMGGEQETRKLTELLSNEDPEVLTGLIGMLGRRGDRSAVQNLSLLIADHSDETVRLAALEAVLNLDQDAFLSGLPAYLARPLSGEEKQALMEHLARIPEERLRTVLNANYADCSDDAKALLLQVCASRECEDMQPLYLEILQTDSPQLRLDALNALEEVADESILTQVLEFGQKSRNSREQGRIARIIAGIYERSGDKRTAMATLVRTWKESETEQKIRMLDIFRSIGGPGALRTIQEDLQTADPELKEAFVRTLADWPDDSALDLLFENLRSTKDSRHRILCVRGIIRLMKDPAIPDIRAVHTLQKLRTFDLRMEEKWLLISALSERGTPDALREVVAFLGDTELNHEAYMACLRLAADEDEESMNKETLTRTILEALAQPALKNKIAAAPVEEERLMNRPPQGFTALFNGRDLSGWKGLVADPPERALMSAQEMEKAQTEADSLMRAHWHVVDGILFFDGKGYNSLCTEKRYRNFELLLDWKIEKDGDSGIYLRGTPQVQIWDPSMNPVGSGGLFNNQKNPDKPLETADRPVGEWNTFRIIMKGERVTVFLNDLKVVDNVILENYWERDKPIYPEEQIELQAHSSPLYFRNIFVREFPDDAGLFDGPLFNGENLEGWRVVGNAAETWKAENGILYTTGEGGGWIATEKEYANFKLNLEFRVPEGGNSGVFLRAPLSGDPAYTGMEIQVLDDHADMYKTLKPWQYTGSVYGLQAPSVRVTKPAGEWQFMEIICNGPNVTVALNGKTINEADLVRYMEQAGAHPGIKRRSGVIGLQNHSSRVEYRNIYLQELPGE